jgi:hypothetical protein
VSDVDDVATSLLVVARTEEAVARQHYALVQSAVEDAPHRGGTSHMVTTMASSE